MTQASLFASAPPDPETHEEIALGDRIAWRVGNDIGHTGRLVYSGQRMVFYGYSDAWLSREEHALFLQNPRGMKGSRDAWMHEDGSFMIARNGWGWWAVPATARVERIA